MGLKNVESQIEAFDALDSKTGVVMGFVVVSIVEILGFLVLAAIEAPRLAEPSKNGLFSGPAPYCFLVGLVLSWASAVCYSLSLRGREVAIGYSYEKLIAAAELKDQEIKTLHLGGIVESIRRNARTLEEKLRYVRIANLLAFGGITCYTLVVGCVFWHYLRGA